MNEKRVHVIISGRVQGVAFRASCQRQANALGVSGWVRNDWDDSVEALFEGSAEAVDEMVRWCYHGPPAADVTSVQVEDAPDSPQYSAFHIRS